jgi:site-specific DNA-methyltransferase (adenine-specific)
MGDVPIVMLLPARTDTKYFHDYIYNKAGVEIRFIKGRLIFGSEEYWKWVWEQEFIDNKKNTLYKKYGRKNSAPFPSMVCIFR